MILNSAVDLIQLECQKKWRIVPVKISRWETVFFLVQQVGLYVSMSLLNLVINSLKPKSNNNRYESVDSGHSWIVSFSSAYSEQLHLQKLEMTGISSEEKLRNCSLKPDCTL